MNTIANVTSFAFGIALLACSSGPAEPTGQETTPGAAHDASAPATTATTATTATGATGPSLPAPQSTSAADAGAATTTHDASTTPPPPPGGGGPSGGPAPCNTSSDCTAQCPGAKGCTCASGPQGKVCVPLCTTNADCNIPGAPPLTCGNGLCVP